MGTGTYSPYRRKKAQAGCGKTGTLQCLLGYLYEGSNSSRIGTVVINARYEGFRFNKAELMQLWLLNCQNCSEIGSQDGTQHPRRDNKRSYLFLSLKVSSHISSSSLVILSPSCLPFGAQQNPKRPQGAMMTNGWP